MVKSVLGVQHLGLRDWVWQRLSALFMVLYLIFLLAFFSLHPDLSYDQWKGLFSFQLVKIASLFLLLSILLHTWVGIWTILTDYVKCFVLRCIFEVLILFGLAASFVWGVIILWGV